MRKQRQALAPEGDRREDDLVDHSRRAQRVKQPAAKEVLADRVYSWAVDELQYQPASRTGTDQKLTGHPEFCPQALKRLCEGPCGPIFEYLVEHIKGRFHALEAQQNQLTKHQETEGYQYAQRKATRNRQQEDERGVQCRQLLISIAMKKQEIARTKERIRQQRQIQTLQEIKQQQSMKKIQILQHYEPLLLKIESDVLAIAGSGQSHRGDPATLESMINAASNEVQTATRMLVLDGMKLRSREGSDLSIARLYEGLNQERVSKSRFLEEIEARKTRLLKRLEQEQSERSSVSKNVRSRASSLLKTFQGHHDERVAEVESVLNQVESCEHERDRLYTKMRQEAQRRLLERRPNDHLQELEETKAHIRGLCSALEFVQSEQLNMVERVVSIEDQSKTLEDMKRTSRSMDLKLAEVQFQMDKLMEMIRLSRQSSSDISNDTALYVTDAIGHRLARLSEMVQQRRAKVETEMDIVKDTISACQQRPQNCVLEILPPDMDAALENEAQKGTNALSMYSVVSDSSLSREQVIVQLSALQQQIAVQSLASTKAKEQAQKMKQAMDSLTTGMKQSVANFSRQVPQESLSQASEAAAGDEDGQLNADNLCSTFEKEVKSAARFVFNLQSVQHHEFSHGVKGILHELQDNKSIIQDIQNVIADGEILHNNNETTTHNDATHYVSSKTGTERKRARLSTK